MHKKAKNKSTVLNLLFKEFLQTSIPPLISVLYAKGYHDFPLRNLCLPVSRKFVGEPFCVSKELWYRKFSSKEGGKLHGFVEKFFISQDRKNFAREPFCVSENFWQEKIFYG